MRILTKRTSSYRIVTSPLPTPEPFPNAHSFFSSLPSYCHLHPLKRKIGRKKEDTRQNCNFGIRDKKRYSLLTCFVLLYFAKKTISLSAKAERGEEGTGEGRGEGAGRRNGRTGSSQNPKLLHQFRIPHVVAPFRPNPLQVALSIPHFSETRR